MEIIFKLGLKFTQKYFKDYILVILKPVFIGFLSLFVLAVSLFNPYLSIICALIMLPVFCYCFWKGYLITYALNYLAYNFIKNDKKDIISSLDECIAFVKKDEKSLISYLAFSALVLIILHIPFIYFLIKNFNISLLSNPFSLLELISNSAKVFLLNQIIVFPFANYLTQAFFFRKEEESFFSLFLNCYRKLDSKGILIALLFTVLGVILGNYILIYIFIVFPLNLFVYSINTFWYYSRIKI